MGSTLLTTVVAQNWAYQCARSLAAARSRLDAANVFPVADSDTGTNMWLTVHDLPGRVDALTADAGPLLVLQEMASGALEHARGNSGVILSEYFYGFALGCESSVAGDRVELGPEVVRKALEAAAHRARGAVGRPVDGTILTAAAAAAREARQAGPDLETVVLTAVHGAREAIGQSPRELAALREAHVVDAGALGLLLVLESLVAAVDGRTDAPLRPVVTQSEQWGNTLGLTSERVASAEPDGSVGLAAHPIDARENVTGTVDTAELEVMLTATLATTEPAATAVVTLRERLCEVSESVVVADRSAESAATAAGVGPQPGLRIHVHTHDPAPVLAATSGWIVHNAVLHRLHRPTPPRPWSVVGVTASPGLLAAITAAGSVAVWAPGGGPGESTLQRAIIDARAETVVVVAGGVTFDETTISKVVAAGREAGVAVRTVHSPGSTDPHLIAVLAADQMLAAQRIDPAAAVAALAGAAARVRVIEVIADASAEDHAARLAAELRSDDDVMSLVVDTDVPEHVTKVLSRAAREAGVDIVVLSSGHTGGRCVLGIEHGA